MEGALTEFEESVSFDVDDPDFAPTTFPNSTRTHDADFDIYAPEINVSMTKREHWTDFSESILTTIVQIYFKSLNILLAFHIRQSDCILF